MIKIGFIGTGNMGGALAMAAARSDGDYELLLANRHLEKAEKLAKRIMAEAEEQAQHSTLPDQTQTSAARGGKTVKICTNKEVAEESDYLFLGVKPQMMENMLSNISPILTKRAASGKRCVLISMAAGIDINGIKKMSGGSCPVIRVMPNTPVEIGEGVVLYTLGDGVTSQDTEELNLMLGKAGMLTELPEKLIDAGSAISGCGPAFTYIFIEALADGGLLCGLTRADAYKFAAQMIAGSAKLMLKSGKHPGELKDAVCSPGGTTIEGVRKLEASGMRGAVMEAVIAACEKNAKLVK